MEVSIGVLPVLTGESAEAFMNMLKNNKGLNMEYVKKVEARAKKNGWIFEEDEE